MERAQLIQELTATELFHDVPDDILAQVLEWASPVTVPTGEVLLSPEHQNEHLYLLLSGSLALHFGSPHSPEIRELGAGVSVGEMSAIDGNVGHRCPT